MTSVQISSFKRSALKAALASAVVLGSTGLVGNAYAASATSTATGTVITPIAITAPVVLSFGKFSSRASGTIKVDTNNAITVTGGVLSGTGATATAAKFDVTGDGSNTYSITHSGAAALMKDGLTSVNDMALAKVSALTAASGTTGNVTSGTLTSGAQSIYVGGTLTVAASQLAGTYTGAVTVAVEYN